MKKTINRKPQGRGRSGDGYEYVTYPTARFVDLDTGKPVTPPIDFRAALDLSMRKSS